MFGSAMLDIAIGVVFVFLLLSVFATTINELIFSLLSMRGKELLRGIQTLLNDNDLVKKVYEHGQVFGLYQGDFEPDPRLSAASPPKTEATAQDPQTKPLSFFRKHTSWFGGKRDNLPSYIPSRNFAQALIDSVEELATELKLKQLLAQGQDAAEAATPPPDPQQAVNPQQPAGQAAIQGQTIVKVTQEFKDAAKALAGNPATAKVGKPLLSMISAAGDDATKLQESIEEWFNSGMDRVSGWYKYNTQWCLFWIGLTIAIAINADTIHIVKQLSSDSTLRQSIVAAAQSTNQAHNNTNPTAGGNGQNPPLGGNAQNPPAGGNAQNPPPGGNGQNPPAGDKKQNPPAGDKNQNPPAGGNAQNPTAGGNGQNPPAGGNAQNPTAGGNGQNPPPQTTDITKQIKAVDESFDNLTGLGIPLGWPKANPKDYPNRWTRFVDCINWVVDRPSMMLGWLLSAIAISLGAPFWFDALNKIMIVRSTIKPGEKSQPGKPKDKSDT